MIIINKGEEVKSVLKKNTTNLSNNEIILIKLYYQFNNVFFKKFIHYGEFYSKKNISSIELFKTISKSSNVLNKFTIIEGWSKEDLDIELSKFFNDYRSIPYDHIIADTYFFNKNIDFNSFLQNLKKNKKNYFDKNIKKKIYQNYSINELMIIGSLIEKEGMDKIDKKKISSVIFNRLKIKMKLQIDATVLYAITNGRFDLKRNLLFSDLKINHPFNTYKYGGLPPEPISYVGKETLDIIFENYKTEFLFYFFDKSLNRHLFSKTYNEHLKKLNEYRKK